VLAGPPSRESCSRDVYDPTLRLDLDVALRIARQIGEAAAHLHGRGMTHGDLYAHNVLWDGDGGQAVLSDFGAASFLPPGDQGALERLEVLAWGRLLGELLDLTDTPPPPVRTLLAECLQPDPRARPSMVQALETLAGVC
jgi:serine/threonine protein kinase